MGRGMAAKGMTRARKVSPPGQAAVVGDGNDGPEEVAAAAAAGGGGGGGFFSCYLLRSLCPRRKGHTYIGFTVNPRRRIRQHNGEIRCGAWRTKRGRPWEMVLCIHGFPTNVSALQFEWAWQHPTKSLAVRKAASSFKSLSGVGNKVKLAYTMLNLPAWDDLNITVNFFSTKNTKFTAGCPALPIHMKTVVCPMEDLQCYAGSLSSEDCSNEPRENQEPDATVRDEPSDHGLQPVEAEIRIAYCESNIEEFDPMEWSGIFRAREMGRSRIKESSEVQPVEEVSTSGCDIECSIDEFANMEWGGIHETRELDGSRTSPQCSSSSWSDDGGGRIVDSVVGQASPMSKVGASSSDDDCNHPLFHETEVVDLVTPVGRLGRKGGKVATICPKVIDLTSSPIIIEL